MPGKSSGPAGGGDFARGLRKAAVPRQARKVSVSKKNAEVSDRLYSNKRHFSQETGRWRSGEACEAPANAARRMAEARRAEEPPLPPRSQRRFHAADEVETPPPPPPPPRASRSSANFGGGIPSWSPYYADQRAISVETVNNSYGDFTRHQYLIDLHEKLARHAAETATQMRALLDPSAPRHH
ncbi:hypothetical protein M885DRAFT_516349 [Pelagophyceae sp. CCMP2097]|nr:hypothetical protein M885DRAFT_516349 [Pelagophyceae sp. CCMP2097]|mmetsp:Transcript_27031/g.90841  ORF Transcript_27031/g.90841 Transcript_27031/m.90841 type:complete len:183 (+) Transcript_27031:67-615(+)